MGVVRVVNVLGITECSSVYKQFGAQNLRELYLEFERPVEVGGLLQLLV